MPGDSPLLGVGATVIAPKLVEFGLHLFGERLRWSVVAEPRTVDSKC